MGETGESERILHVDDDGEFTALTAEYLQRTSEHLVVEAVTSASEALSRLDGDTFDCVVSDYEMPEMDGLALLDAVRERHPDLPFILFTGKGSEAVASEAIARGVTDYLQKRPGTERFELLANRIENASEQYRASRRADRFARRCRLVRELNRVLVRAETREEIERRVCETISDIGPYHFAWIGGHDDTGTVEPRATAGIEAQYLDDVEITADENETGRGPTGRAIRTRKPAVVEDISAADAYGPWRDEALDRGYRASAAIPLVDGDRLEGVLNVYANRPGIFDDREREVLSELGSDIAHAIGRVERLARDERYERVVENLPMGVYRVTADDDGDIVDANAALADIFGADSAETMLDHAASEFYLDDGDHTALRRQLASDGIIQNAELRQQTLDGDRIWVSVTAIRTEMDDGAYVDGIVQDITERKRRERRRRQFRSAVEHAGHVVLITDPDGTIEYVNGAFEDVTGYAASEAIGRRPSMLQSGRHSEAFYRNLWETISSGEVWEGEIVNECKGGAQYIIDQTIAPITDDEENISGFVAINRNITERKERELNLAFLKQAIDQAGIGIGTYGADGYATYVNERLAELFGTDRNDLRARHLADLDPDLDRGQFSKYWESFADGERRIYDTNIERVDTGEVVPAEIVTSRVTIDGRPYQVNTVRDATDRKRQEGELERFRSAVEHAGHSVLITDPDGTIEYVNGAFEAMSGYSAAEAIDRTPRLLRSGEHDDAFYRDLWETILGGEVWQGEVINEEKDGAQYVVDQTIAPITDDGSITGFVGINRDVTPLKEYERELEAQNDRLKQYGQTVAHDLRNPLALLDAELTQFEATIDPEDEAITAESVRRFCTDIGTTVDRMLALIDDLLAMAEHGQRVLAAEPTSIEAVATDAWEQIDTESATLSVEDAELDADPDRLRELLANLFRNSVEHGSTNNRTASGDTVEHAGDEVHVRVQPLDFTEGFAVEDDGPGIPEDEREDVFERGFTTAETGTGFGLAIVEQIAHAHDWSVTVTEGADGGARFEFRLGRGV